MNILTTVINSALALKVVGTLSTLFKARFEEPLKAKGEISAAIIKENGRHELSLLQVENQAVEIAQLTGLQGIYQSNVQSIILKAIELANENNEIPSNDIADSSWILSFIDYAKNISDEQIQNLWSKILADEINSPGSFSLRTLELLKQISKSEAELFAEFCSYLLFIEGSSLYPCYFIDTYGSHQNRFITRVFNKKERILLAELGLVNFIEDIFFSFRYEQFHSIIYNDKKIGVIYKGKERRGAPEEIKTIICGHQLTRSGNELYKLCSKTFHHDFFENTKKILLSLEFEINENTPKTSMQVAI